MTATLTAQVKARFLRRHDRIVHEGEILEILYTPTFDVDGFIPVMWLECEKVGPSYVARFFAVPADEFVTLAPGD